MKLPGIAILAAGLGLFAPLLLFMITPGFTVTELVGEPKPILKLVPPV